MKRSDRPTDILVGERLRSLRTMRGLTMGELAKKIGLSYQQVYKYETGDNSLSAHRMENIAKTLGVTPNYLFGLAEAPTITEQESKFSNFIHAMITIQKDKPELFTIICKLAATSAGLPKKRRKKRK